MKKLFKLSVIFLLSCFLSDGSFAFVVFDPTACGYLYTQVTTLTTQLEKVTGVLEQAKKQVDYLTTVSEKAKEQAAYLQNGAKLATSFNWGNVQGKINELGDIVKQANNIAYSAADLDQRFTANFPGYKAPSNYSEQYGNIVTNTLSTLNSILRAMGSNAQNFTSETDRIKSLQTQSQSAQGQMQAIQAASQIASEEATQLQLLRQTVIAQTNAQTAYYAAEMQKDATKEAALDGVIKGGKADAPNIGGSGNAINVPDF